MNNKRMRFKNNVIVVTGAAQGMGKSIAKKFVEEGAMVALLDRNFKKLKEVWSNLGCNNILIKCIDVSIKKEVEDVFNEIVKKWGKIDVLVNNAGVIYPTKIELISEHEWNKVIDVNLTGVFWCSQKAYIIMKENRKGIIINNASSAGKRTSTLGGIHYTASKAALLGLTRHFAREAGIYNIRVNAICPGIIDTEMVRRSTTSEQIKEISNKLPLKRIGKPSEVADLVAYLASDDSSYITGAAINICGGELTLP